MTRKGACALFTRQRGVLEGQLSSPDGSGNSGRNERTEGADRLVDLDKGLPLKGCIGSDDGVQVGVEGAEVAIVVQAHSQRVDEGL